MAKYTEAQNKATQKYQKSHMKRIPLSVQNADYAVIKDFCDEHGYKVNTFIQQAIRAQIPDWEERKNKAGN